MTNYNTTFPWGVNKRVAPKYHKAVCISLGHPYDMDGNTLDHVIRMFQSWKTDYADLLDPRILLDQYDDYCDMYLTGFVPMTEVEIKKVDSKRVKDADARKRRAEKLKAQELVTLQKLKQKYEGA